MGAFLASVGASIVAEEISSSFSGGVTMRVRIHGLKELLRDLEAAEAGARKEMLAELKEAGGQVAAEWRGRMGGYAGASVGTIGPRASSRGVFVTQRAGPVTGKRGDFGALTMRHGIGALSGLEDQIARDVEQRIDWMLKRHGL